MARDKSRPRRSSQLLQAYKATQKLDPKLGLILLGVFLGVAVVAAVALSFVFGYIYSAITGVLLGALATLIVFGRRAQAANFNQIEGQPGAAAAALGILRRGWHIEPMVAVTKQQDIITRAVGAPGIVLIGDGNPNRLKPLMTSERRRHERVAADIPIHEIYMGDSAGQVPLRKLSRHVSKMKRGIKPAEMTDVLQRLKAVDANRNMMPIPKGPVPHSMKGQRGNLRGR